MKGYDVGAVVGHERIAVMGGESKDGFKISGGSVSQRGIKEEINIINISREGRELEDLGTSKWNSMESSRYIAEFKGERRSG